MPSSASGVNFSVFFCKGSFEKLTLGRGVDFEVLTGFGEPMFSWQPLGPLLKVTLLVGYIRKIPRSTQRSV